MSTQADGKKDEKGARRVALIGLVGTILTVCGGLGGALIGGFTTLYKMQAEAKKLAIAAPAEETALEVDTRRVDISLDEAQGLNPDDWLVYPDLGFVMAQPGEGWALQELMYEDLFYEQATNLSPLILFYELVGYDWDGQEVRRLRQVRPLMVEFVEGSRENGVVVDPAALAAQEYSFYNQVTILRLDKEAAYGWTLYNLALSWGGFHQGGVNSIVSDPDSRYVFEQVTWQLEDVRVDGRLTNLDLERWGLFAEGEQAFYIVEVQYVPDPGGSVRTWDDLQAYLSAFRVIR